VRLTGLWRKWEQISEIEKTYDSLRDNIFKTKLMSLMNPGLTVYLKLQKVDSLIELIDLADVDLKAHERVKTNTEMGNKNTSFNPKSGNQFVKKNFMNNVQNTVPKNTRQNFKGRKRSLEEGDQPRREIICFICGLKNYKAHDYPNRNIYRGQML